METPEEDFEFSDYSVADFVPEEEASNPNRRTRDRIEYWQELRRLRHLLDDPSFSDL